MSIDYDLSLIDRGYSHTEESIALPRYRWYSYKEGFSPLLVEHAINSTGLKKGDSIVDPFNGSGTVSLYSSANGYACDGYEINPFSAFIARTKQISLTNLELMKFEEYRNQLNTKVVHGKLSPLCGFSTFTQSLDKEKWLFNTEVLNAFEGGMEYLTGLKNKKIKDLFKLALLASAMENCNAKKDGKCLRYKKNWRVLNYNSVSFVESLNQILEDYINDIKSTPLQNLSTIHLGDSKILTKDLKLKFKLCITSPPYLNSFDYTDIYRPELFMGNFIVSQDDFRKLKRSTLRSHVINTAGKNTAVNFGLLYATVIKQIVRDSSSLWSKGIPLMIQNYFEDMLTILKNLRTRCDNHAEVWIVVGNSAYADIEIPTDLIIADIAKEAKWYLKQIQVLRYIHKRGTKYSPNVQKLRESIVILSATPC